jgi:hypothetical protein
LGAGGGEMTQALYAHMNKKKKKILPSFVLETQLFQAL